MNIFLFFYLFVLFVLLTPGVIITLSIMKSSPYSKWIVASIHGFLFSAIAITTYSFVNELYLSLITTENMVGNVSTGYTFNSADGPKLFNDPSQAPPSRRKESYNRGPDIKCGKYKFCVSADPVTKRAYCYGYSGQCKWGENDCTNDNDCINKYNSSSIKYSDSDYSYSSNCNNINSTDGWVGDTCNMARFNMRDKKFT